MVGRGLLVYPILLFSLHVPLSRSPDMTEILLTGTLNLNSINQYDMGLNTRKPVFEGWRKTMAQISPHIGAV